MTFEEVFRELKTNGTKQNRKAFKKHGAGSQLFGVSFSFLNSIKNQITSPEGQKGIHHPIAKKLWKTGNIDSRLLACMIADPELLTRKEAMLWANDISYYILADYFSKLIARTKFGADTMYLWIQSPNEFTKRIGFSILNIVASEDKSKSDLFFIPFIGKIRQEIQTSPNRAKEAMNNCLIGIGCRSENLKEKVLEAAHTIGKIEIDHGDTGNKHYDVLSYWDLKN